MPVPAKNDERGELALVKPDPSGFVIVSRMKVTEGTGSQWAHPVIITVIYILLGVLL